MTSMNINLGDLIVPPGEYPVRVESVSAKKSQAGSMYLNWLLVIDGGDREDHPLWMVTSLKPEMQRLLCSTFAAVGVDVSAEIAIEWDDIDLEVDKHAPLLQPELEGRRAVAVVAHYEYRGMVREKVKRLLPRTD